ncbi:uncharacterized protein [Battus philenor]|uniref:uncharacterized protein n=1 Tax=Battus philenor TaxID=42288 RepID=UPI0035CFB50C
MYKLTAVFLAICLLNVHAYVRRDAESTKNENYLERIKNQLQEISKNVGDKLHENLNPDQLKAAFNNAIDKISNAWDPNKKIEDKQQ